MPAIWETRDHNIGIYIYYTTSIAAPNVSSHPDQWRLCSFTHRTDTALPANWYLVCMGDTHTHSERQ
jgi:hypothetical protein